MMLVEYSAADDGDFVSCSCWRPLDAASWHSVTSPCNLLSISLSHFDMTKTFSYTNVSTLFFMSSMKSGIVLCYNTNKLTYLLIYLLTYLLVYWIISLYQSDETFYRIEFSNRITRLTTVILPLECCIIMFINFCIARRPKYCFILHTPAVLTVVIKRTCYVMGINFTVRVSGENIAIGRDRPSISVYFHSNQLTFDIDIQHVYGSWP